MTTWVQQHLQYLSHSYSDIAQKHTELKSNRFYLITLKLKFLTNGIQLVNEDDGWSLLLGEGKGITHQLCSISNKHLDQLRTSKFKEGRFGLGSTGTGQKGLASPRWTIQQYSLRWLDTWRKVQCITSVYFLPRFELKKIIL